MMLYRVFTFVVNFFAIMLGMSALLLFAMIIGVPQATIDIFLLTGVLIYAWYANVFLKKVLINNGTITKKEREWLIVNGVVAIVFCVKTMISLVTAFLDPKVLEDTMNNMVANNSGTEQTTHAAFISLLHFMTFCTTILFAHIIWTWVLLKKHKDKIV